MSSTSGNKTNKSQNEILQNTVNFFLRQKNMVVSYNNKTISFFLLIFYLKQRMQLIVSQNGSVIILRIIRVFILFFLSHPPNKFNRGEVPQVVNSDFPQYKYLNLLIHCHFDLVIFYSIPKVITFLLSMISVYPSTKLFKYIFSEYR